MYSIDIYKVYTINNRIMKHREIHRFYPGREKEHIFVEFLKFLGLVGESRRAIIY